MEGKNQKRPRVAESSGPMKGTRKNYANKRQWTKNEDDVLVDCLVELTKDSTWKGENGFRTDYLQHLKKVMASRPPLSNLKATPHIESRCKLLKRQFHAINEMVNHSSGFEWNDLEKCITASKDVFDDWVKVNSIKLQQLKFPFFFCLQYVIMVL